MDLSSIAEKLNLRIICGHEKLSVKVTGGYVGDLLSDVMANTGEGCLWITRQTHQNIVAVASLKELAGIILVNGKDPDGDTIDKASAEEIPIFVTELSAFDIAGKLYTIIS
jgi:predicted transcriptional regulator